VPAQVASMYISCVHSSGWPTPSSPPPAGPSKNRTLAYDWAIISGGAPNTPTDNGLCRTGGSLLPQSRQYFGGMSHTACIA
jgi:hypothetical protein